MKKINREIFGFLFSVLVGVTAVSPLGAAAAYDTDINAQSRSEAEIATFVAELEAQLAYLQALLAERLATTPATGFSIKINETAIPVAVPRNRQEAETLCGGIAYAPANMWQLVTCTYNGDVLYRDVFIAG